MIFVYLSISFSTERLNKRFDDKRRQFTKPEKEFAFIIYIHVCCLHQEGTITQKKTETLITVTNEAL